MTGVDFLCARSVRSEELRSALVAALGVSNDQVEVVESIEESSGSRPIVAEFFDAKGDFQTQVSLYIADDQQRRVGLAEIRRVSELLDTAILLTGESVNPYELILVPPRGPERKVGLDPESLDVRDEYRLLER